jgi:lipoate-protein ligase A
VTRTADTALRAADAAAEQEWNDAALARPVVVPALGVWTYRAPAIVLGRGQRDVPAGGPAIVRRQSGGGAVLVGPHLVGVSVALPRAHPFVAASPARTFRWFGAAHAAALRGLGIACATVEPAAVRTSSVRWACFGGLGPWEVVGAEGRKLVGMAQCRRTTGVLLVSGTLVAEPDWGPFCAAFGRPDAAGVLAEATSSCARELGAPLGADVVARSIVDAIVAALDGPRETARAC